MTPLDALQTTLAGEHAAVYVYGVVGGRVSSSAQPSLAAAVTAAYVVHRGRRDHLTAVVRAAGGTPVAAAVSYELPDPARTTSQLRRAALDVEQRCAGVYAQLVAHTTGAERSWAAGVLSDAAVRQLGFAGRPEVFPGVAEL